MFSTHGSCLVPDLTVALSLHYGGVFQRGHHGWHQRGTDARYIEEIKPYPQCHSSLGEEHSNVGIRLSLHTFYMKLRPVASTCCLCYIHLSGLVRLKFHWRRYASCCSTMYWYAASPLIYGLCHFLFFEGSLWQHCSFWSLCRWCPSATAWTSAQHPS